MRGITSPPQLGERAFERMGAADRQHRNPFRHEIAAPSGGERLEGDPIALALDEDDCLHNNLLNGVLLSGLWRQITRN